MIGCLSWSSSHLNEEKEDLAIRVSLLPSSSSLPDERNRGITETGAGVGARSWTLITASTPLCSPWWMGRGETWKIRWWRRRIASSKRSKRRTEEEDGHSSRRRRRRRMTGHFPNCSLNEHIIRKMKTCPVLALPARLTWEGIRSSWRVIMQCNHRRRTGFTMLRHPEVSDPTTLLFSSINSKGPCGTIESTTPPDTIL